MVIEIDRKKVAKAKRRIWLYIIVSVLGPLYHGWIALDALINGKSPIIIGVLILSNLFWLMMGGLFWQTIRRGLRHIRTEHHLYMDETGLTIVNGHARVDIPWGDVENIVMSKVPMTPHDARNFKIQLRKESPYSKRTYRLYNDYECSLDALYEQINEAWTAGQAKPKLLTI